MSLGRWWYRLALQMMRVWWAVRRPRSAGVRCVLRRGRAFVLVRHTYGDTRWMLPGGRLRRGEDPVSTAIREMRQELGVAATRVARDRLRGARSGYRRQSRAEPYRRHSTYYLEADVQSPLLQPRPAELADAAWFTVDRLPSNASDALDLPLGRG
jgi:8-oxo-dGTP pyrophosphatase MutT (NUDIX family)